MMSRSIKNRRVFNRYSCNFLVSIQDKTSDSEGDIQAKDISAAGIGVLSQTKLKRGDDLEIWIHLPENASPIHTFGTIVWIQKDSGFWRAGVEFDTFDLLPLGIGLEKIQGLQ